MPVEGAGNVRPWQVVIQDLDGRRRPGRLEGGNAGSVGDDCPLPQFCQVQSNAKDGAALPAAADDGNYVGTGRVKSKAQGGVKLHVRLFREED